MPNRPIALMHGRQFATRAFDRILIIMFENQYRGYVLGNAYMRRLARRGIQLGNYFGVMHPSQTNYIASIAGELCNVTSDDRPPLLPERTIVDLLEEAPGRLRWKGYMESYVPSAVPWTSKFLPQDASPYFIKHNPFSSFSSIIRNRERWRQIDNDAGFFADVLNGTLPQYAWFTPNIWSDGHWIDGTEIDPSPRAPLLVDQQARWLEGFFAKLRFPGPDSYLPPRTLVVVTFDESDFESDYKPDLASSYDGPNQIYTILLGDGCEPGFEEEGYNHYSLLRTVEQNFGLDHLGKNDAGANWFRFLWDQRFAWSVPGDTPFAEVNGRIAAAGFAGALFVACADAGGSVNVRTRSEDSGAWSEEQQLQIDGSGGLAMASTFTDLILMALSASGTVQCRTYNLQSGWSRIPVPIDTKIAAISVISFARESKIMFAGRDVSGAVFTRVYANGRWGKLVNVEATRSDGGIVLGTLGAAVYLIVKTPAMQSMSVVSYNSADFNAVTVKKNKYGGPWDDTTVDAWSPSAFPVAHFSGSPDAGGKRQPLTRPYETAGPIAAATLDGVLHLVHPGPGNPQLMTESFSLSGVMTPGKPVSYKNADRDVNNGFGTLVEAGWSKQRPIFPARCDPGGALAMARSGHKIALLYRSGKGSRLQLIEGSYTRANS